MQQALHANKTISTTPVSMLFVGAPRSGKSTLLKRLIEGVHYIVKPSEELPSTPISTQPISVEIRRLTPTLAIIQHSRWIKQNYTGEKRLLVSYFLRKIAIDEDSAIPSEQPYPQEVAQPELAGDAANHDISNIDQMSLVTIAASKSTPSSKLESSHAEEQPAMSSSTMTSLVYDTPQEILSVGLQETVMDEAEESLDGSMILHILDTGGQPEYLNLLPSLLSGPALNVLVFRLIDDLKKRYIVRFVPTEGGTPSSYMSSYTVEEALLQAYTCVSHHTPPQLSSIANSDLPRVSSHSSTLLVGTHKDALKEDIKEARVHDTDKKLEMKFRDIDLEDNQLIKATAEQLVFAVDNTDPEDAGFIALQDALLTTLERDFHPVELPLTWMMFYLAIQSSKKNVLSLKQCRVIAESCGISSDDDLKLALWYLSHQFGVIR